MLGQDVHDVERKILAILKILSSSPEPLGGRLVARRLGEFGIELSERAVRYHLKLMDERGLTHYEGRRDGRTITPLGIEELRGALVGDRVGYVADQIEVLAYQTSFDPAGRSGEVPVDATLFNQEDIPSVLEAMEGAFSAGICVSDMIALAAEGEYAAGMLVPSGKAALSMVSSVALVGALLKAGIPLESKFGGVVEIRERQPFRFIDLIEFSSCTIRPAEVFIATKMTCVGQVARGGSGKIVASLHETPAVCRPLVEDVINGLRAAGLGGLIAMGQASEPVCEVPVGINKVGLVMQSGLNPVAAAGERGLEVEPHAMVGLVKYGKLRNFWELREGFRG